MNKRLSMFICALNTYDLSLQLFFFQFFSKKVFLQNENHKTDGGLGAGTPMFISEVMHGNTCVIL